MTIPFWIHNLFTWPTTRQILKVPRRTRLAVETLEDRTVLAPIAVTTFADVVADDDLTSLREAVAEAAVVPGDDQIHVPAGEYDLDLGQLSIDDTTGRLTIKGVGGVATIDAQGAD